MIRAITQRSADVDLAHRLARETATWDDLEGCGVEHPTVEAADEHLAANGGGWLWFADDDTGELKIHHEGPDHDNPGNWPDDEGLWP